MEGILTGKPYAAGGAVVGFVAGHMGCLVSIEILPPQEAFQAQATLKVAHCCGREAGTALAVSWRSLCIG